MRNRPATPCRGSASRPGRTSLGALALTAALVVLPGVSRAGLMTVDPPAPQDTKELFSWRVKWDRAFGADTLSMPLVHGPGANYWTVSISVVNLDADTNADDISIQFIHRVGPHEEPGPPVDNDPGESFEVKILNAHDTRADAQPVTNTVFDRLKETPANQFRTLARNHVKHDARPNQHRDLYRVDYLRPAGASEIFFDLSGLHEATAVPEPSTLALGMLGLLSAAGYRWRHLARRA